MRDLNPDADEIAGTGGTKTIEQEDTDLDSIEICTPRPYQIELLEAARNENTIAYLETGAGKTLIAALLIRDVLRSNAGSTKRLAVFVVDRVPLVIQQANYVQRVLGKEARVGLFYGDMGLETWGEEIWGQTLADKNALFMTAQVLLDALRHDVIHFETIALLIFDEAHHTTKAHPFNAIMREFYHPARAENLSVPRVFGMSASPVKIKKATGSKDFCSEAMSVLQSNLQAKVVIVSNASQEIVDSYVPKPEEYILKYRHEKLDEQSDVKNTAFSPIESNINPLDTGELVSSAETATTALEAVEEELGRYAAGYLRVFQGPNKKTISESIDHAEIPMITHKAAQLLELVAYERQRWRSMEDIDTSFRCIVFVQRRAVAAALTWLVNQVFGAIAIPELHACAVLGCHSAFVEKSATLSMTATQQARAIRRFRSGEYGIMIATNVLEEGFDVPSCGLVVMFSTIASSKAYIQSRGRARHPRSRYVVMVASSGLAARDASKSIRLARDGADVMKLVVTSLDDTNSINQVAHTKSESMEAGPCCSSIAVEPFMQSKTTRARITATAALNMLYQFSASLPADKYHLADGPSGPSYDVTQTPTQSYLCTVTLPTSAPVCKGICDEPQPSRMKAKRLAALHAYRQLYDCGALDEHLFPKEYPTRYPWKVSAGDNTVVTLPKCVANINAKRAMKRATTRSRPCTVNQPFQIVWRRSQEAPLRECNAFLYRISLFNSPRNFALAASITGSEHYAIVTRYCLHEDELLCLQAPAGVKLFTLIPMGRISFSGEDDKIAMQYAQSVSDISLDKLRSVPGENDVQGNYSASVSHTATSEDHPCGGTDLNNTLRHDLPPIVDSKSLFMPGFHLVPLTDTFTIDWVAMKRVVDFDGAQWSRDRKDMAPSMQPESLQYSLVQSCHDSRYRVYFANALSENLTVTSSCGGIVGNGEFGTFKEYFEQRHGTFVEDSSQRMLGAYSKKTIGKEPDRNVFYLVPEFCRLVPLSPWALYYMELMPFWQIYLALQSVRRRLLADGSIPFHQYATALQPRRSYPHCLGINYERLEFLGDAVLKVLASLAVYQKHPYHHEGLLTAARDEVVCNFWLCDRAIGLELFNIVALTGAPVKPKTWPWYLASPPETFVNMSEKLLADVVESLIGVHYLHGGIRLAASALETLHVLPGMSSYMDRTFIQPARKGAGDSTDPRVTSTRLDAVENIIGYKFRRRAILVEALTHSSYTVSPLYCYQRLEFLGDAVLGLIVINRFFARYPEMEPSQLTSIKEFGVSNDLFGRVILTHGLHEYLWHNSKSLANDINDALLQFKREDTGEDLFESTMMPKVLGDILEALIGAIVVDQDMKLEGLDDVVERLMGETLHRFANPSALAQHPVTRVAQYVQSQYQTGPEFVYSTEPESGIHDSNFENATQFRCTIRVDGTDIASAVGPSRKKAKRCAATAALTFIKIIPDFTDLSD